MNTSSRPTVARARALALLPQHLAVALFMVLAAAHATDIQWQGGTADYNVGANWAGGLVPGAGDNAINDSGSNNVVQINVGDPNWTLTDIRAGNGLGDGAFEQNGQTVTLAGWLRLGVAAGNTGVYTMNGGTVNYQGGQFDIGELGSGIFTLSGGAIRGSGNLAVNLGAVYDGSGALNANTSILNQSNGTVALSGQFFVGNRGSGIYNLSGGSLDVTNWIAIGRSSGTGTVNMTGGSLNQDGGGANLLVGTGYQNNGTPASGVLNQSGGSIRSQGEFQVPENAPSTGTYNLSGTGTLVVNNWLVIGRGGATGTVNISGGSITKTGNTGNHLDIGADGIGTITQTGGALTNVTSDTWLAEKTNGTWNLSGGIASLATVIIGVNNGATGTFNLNGGVLIANEIKGNAGAGTLNLNSGTLRAGANGANLMHDLSAATIGASGITLDSAGRNVTLSQSLLDNSSGPVTKIGSGNITLLGANTYRGNNVVNAGKLITSTTSSGGGSFTVANGAGMGVVITVANTQLKAPVVTLGSSGAVSLDFDFGASGNPTLAPLNVTSSLGVNGATTVNILSNSILRIGQCPLLKYAARTGSGTFVLGSLPATAQAHLVTNTANSSIDLVVDVAPLSESTTLTFVGQGSTGWTPPDPNAAVGPNHIVQFANNSLAIFDKTGKLLSSQDLSSFFGWNTSGDGHVIYDEISRRFAVEVLSTNATVAFAVSDTSDPTGSWHKISISVPGLWDGYGGNGIGYNADAYVVKVNGFNNSFAVVAASNNVNLAYTLVTAPSNVRIGRPVPMAGATAGGPFYFLEGNDDGVNGTGGTLGYVEVVKVSNILNGSRTYTDYQVRVGSEQTSVINTSWRNNQLAAIGKVGSPASIRWYLLNTSSGASLLQSGAITPEDSGDADDTSIAVAPNGCLGLTWLSVMSSTTGMYVSGRAPNDATGTMRLPRQLFSGPNSNGRLGDYSSCVVDIDTTGVAQSTFWACNEVLNSTDQFNWGTRLANFSLPIGGAVPAPTTGVTATPGYGRVTLAWTANPNATSYNLKRSATSGGPYTTIASLEGRNYTDTGLANVPYYYVVTGVNPSGESANSAEVSATPSLAAALATWYAADAISGLANGAAVATWTDQGNLHYNATQGTASQQPSYVLNAMNGLPVVRFNAANSSFLAFSRPVQDDFTQFIVYQSSQNNQGTGTSFWNGGGLVNGDQPYTLNDFGASLNANGQLIVGTGNPDTSIHSGNGFNDGKPHVVTFKRTESTGSLALYVDGVQVAAGTGNTQALTAPATLDLGAVPSGGGFFSGDIAEVKFYNAALANTDRAAQETALMQKWGRLVPSAPSGLTAVPSSTQVTLNWNSSLGATSYNLKRSLTNGGPYTLVAALNQTSYTDTSVANGFTYYYVVSATNAAGQSANSASVSATMPQVALTLGTQTSGQFSFQFQAANGQSFVVEMSTDLVNWVPVATNTPSGGNFIFTDPDASAPARFYRVRE